MRFFRRSVTSASQAVAPPEVPGIHIPRGSGADQRAGQGRLGQLLNYFHASLKLERKERTHGRVQSQGVRLDLRCGICLASDTVCRAIVLVTGRWLL
jgi:hypothetical protein